MRAGTVAVAALAVALVAGTVGAEMTMQSFEVRRGAHPQAVAPAADGTVWYTAQHQGVLGRLDPATGAVEEIALGEDSRPHSLTLGPDGAVWVADGGLNAVVRVDPATHVVETFPLPSYRGNANLSGIAFDADGILWFTGQTGVYGRLDPASGKMKVQRAPRGPGPYGIAATPDGEVYFASPVGDYLARIDRASGKAEVIEVPAAPGAERLIRTEDDQIVSLGTEENKQGPRRLWPDSAGRIWVSEWFAGEVGVYDPADGSWREWRLPGATPQPYAVYVDEHDKVWLTDFSADAIVRFDPATETFERFATPRPDVRIRQLRGRPGEIWGAESRTDHIVLLRTGQAGAMSE